MSKVNELAKLTEADNIACINDQADKKYNGWANYETWNIMLWCNNDPIFYEKLQDVIQENNNKIPYSFFQVFAAVNLKKDFVCTPDGVSFFDRKLDLKEINEALREIFIQDTI